jgi:hypothetical protein
MSHGELRSERRSSNNYCRRVVHSDPAVSLCAPLSLPMHLLTCRIRKHTRRTHSRSLICAHVYKKAKVSLKIDGAEEMDKKRRWNEWGRELRACFLCHLSLALCSTLRGPRASMRESALQEKVSPADGSDIKRHFSVRCTDRLFILLWEQRWERYNASVDGEKRVARRYLWAQWVSRV